jgi:hypothetical protein
MGSLGTAAAFWVTYRLLRREADRDEDAADARKLQAAERRRQQATLVACWYHEEQINEAPEYEYGAKILNASTLPVYDVRIQWARERTTHEDVERAWKDVVFYLMGFDVVAPSNEPRLVIPPVVSNFTFGDNNFGLVRLGVQMTFRDSANVRWIRRIDGTLDEDHGHEGSLEPPGWEFIRQLGC